LSRRKTDEGALTTARGGAAKRPASPVALFAAGFALSLLVIGGWVLVTRAARSSAPEATNPPESGSAPLAAQSRDATAAADGEAPARVEDEPELPLAASVYSLPSNLVPAAQAAALLAAVRAADPERELLVLADSPQRAALATAVAPLRVRLLDTGSRVYSPWPRDPFSFARAAGGAVRVVVRPNLQPGREIDGDLGRELVNDLPSDLDRKWGGVRWSTAAVPFHNGQVLLTHDAAWVTLHTFEPRALQMLGVTRVPVETFGSVAGIDAYVTATRRAADELGTLYGRPVRFVHPLPAIGAGTAGANDVLAAATELMRRIGGGAGYDLDSLVTFLPVRGGRSAALVADLAAGQRLIADAPPTELATLAKSYDLRLDADLRAGLTAEASGPAGRALASFLDLIGAHLAAQGLDVNRLPLLLVPTTLLRDGGEPRYPHFLLGWNNVVVETRDGAVRAEGFASLLPSGDALARSAFAAAGARLDLFPPLVESVVRNGGYRCASNHLRRAARTGSGV
jgi:hypothetical protein